LRNGLALNPSKTEAIQFSLGRGRSCVDDIQCINVSDVAIQPASTLKSIGVVLDRRLSFDQQVSNVCTACYYHIRAQCHILDSLSGGVARAIACSVVSSRLDYCNALYAGMSADNFNKLQRVKNTLARVTLKLGKSDHITPSLIQLHWLWIHQHVNFKLATLTYKILHTGQPCYRNELIIDFYQPVRQLRSSSQGLLYRHRSRTVLASGGFKHSSVAVWNNLPVDFRNCSSLSSFRSRLKTHLFCAHGLDTVPTNSSVT